MNQENTDVYEDFYLNRMDSNLESAQQQHNSQQSYTQKQTEDIYYRSLQEHLPKLDPIKPSDVTFLRKRTMNQDNAPNNNTAPSLQADTSQRMKRQR